MISIIDGSIESIIIAGLQKKEVAIVDLIASIQKKRPSTTKQGVYRVIRKLREQEILVVYHGIVSLNHVWIGEMMKFFSIAKHQYAREIVTDDGFLNLEFGDCISYRFRSPFSTDYFWGHAFSVLSDISSERMPVFIYNPHEWFLITRHEEEKRLFDDLKKRGMLLLVTVGTDTPLDKWVRREFDQEKAQYAIDTSYAFKRNYYVNILGEYLIEVYLDTSLSSALDEYYAKKAAYDANVSDELKKIVIKRGKNRLVISRDPKKASRMRKQLAKNFYIPKQYSLTI